MATVAATNDQLKNNKLFDVANFPTVVTGGVTGIGLMITQTLVTDGARVYITGLDTVVKQFNTRPGKIIG